MKCWTKLFRKIVIYLRTALRSTTISVSRQQFWIIFYHTEIWACTKLPLKNIMQMFIIEDKQMRYEKKLVCIYIVWRLRWCFIFWVYYYNTGCLSLTWSTRAVVFICIATVYLSTTRYTQLTLIICYVLTQFNQEHAEMAHHPLIYFFDTCLTGSPTCQSSHWEMETISWQILCLRSSKVCGLSSTLYLSVNPTYKNHRWSGRRIKRATD